LTREESRRIEVQEPRSVLQIAGAALALYGRYPVLLAVLALAVVTPYELLVLAVTGSAPLGHQSASPGTSVILSLLDVALVGPFVSALYVQAVATIDRGERPTLLSVAQRGLLVLPVVAAAQIVAAIGIGIGVFAFVIPGVILLIRWAVVAQVAAAERTDWLGALRRSGQLTAGNYVHVLGLVALTTVVTLLLSQAGEAVTGTSAHAPQVALGIVVQTVVRSFAALTTAILFFDLLARKAASPKRAV
jgi:hypothetical protein